MPPIDIRRCIYCDETSVQGYIAFALGGLFCSKIRAEKLKTELAAVREKHAYSKELKWNKIPSCRLNMYRDFVKVFVNNRYARFCIMAVKKGPSWQKWGKTDNERLIFKPYYWFFNICLHPYYSYDVYVDYRTIDKKYRWDTLQFLNNDKHMQDWDSKHKIIQDLIPTDSKSEDLIQLTDIVLGSMLHNPNSKPKNAIIELLCECKEEKIYPHIFTPRIRAELHLRKAKYNMSYINARKYFENELNCLNGECDVPYDK